MYTIWFVEIHLEIIRLRSQYGLDRMCLALWWQKYFERLDNLLTRSQQAMAINSSFIDILAPIHLTSIHCNWCSSTGMLSTEFAIANLQYCTCLVCVLPFIVKFIGYLFEYNYCIQITINFDCLTDSIKWYPFLSLSRCSCGSQLESEFIANDPFILKYFKFIDRIIKHKITAYCGYWNKCEGDFQGFFFKCRISIYLIRKYGIYYFILLITEWNHETDSVKKKNNFIRNRFKCQKNCAKNH